MFFVIAFIVGMIVGGCFGVFTAALAVAAKSRDDFEYYQDEGRDN